MLYGFFYIYNCQRRDYNIIYFVNIVSAQVKKAKNYSFLLIKFNRTNNFTIILTIYKLDSNIIPHFSKWKMIT